MASVIYRALPKTTFNFSALGAGQTFGYVVAEHIDVTNWSEMNVIWRLHSYSITQSPSIKLEVWSEIPTEEDPGMNSEVGSISSKTQALSGLPLPWLWVMGNTFALWYSLRVKVFGIQGATAGNLTFSLSADIIGKS